MSFEKINNINSDNISDRACVMIVNFNQKELSMIKNISRLIGIKDHIVLCDKNGNSKIKDILEENISDDCENGYKNKSIIFNCIPHQRINAFLDSLKKMRINRPLTAVVTETSIEWSLNNLIMNLVEERNAMASGKTINHK